MNQTLPQSPPGGISQVGILIPDLQGLELLREYIYVVSSDLIYDHLLSCVVVVYLLSHVQLFCNPMDYSYPGSCPWDFPGKNTGVDCHFLLQGIFLVQELNLHLLHWQVDSLPLRRQGSPFVKVEPGN